MYTSTAASISKVARKASVQALSGSQPKAMAVAVPVLAAALLTLFFLVCAVADIADEGGPFGLSEFVEPDTGSAHIVWGNLRKLTADFQAELPRLNLCSKHPADCTVGERELESIVQETEKADGRTQIEVVNKRVNAAIRYTPDMEQWGQKDVWSLPANVNQTGSLGTGKGDCEDYALAKYLALRLVGYKPKELLMVIVHDNFVHEDHAILTVRYENHWLILDNRWDTLYDDHDRNLVSRFKPVLAINEYGVARIAQSFTFASLSKKNIPPASGR